MSTPSRIINFRKSQPRDATAAALKDMQQALGTGSGVKAACKAAGLARSTYYRNRNRLGMLPSEHEERMSAARKVQLAYSLKTRLPDFTRISPALDANQLRVVLCQLGIPAGAADIRAAMQAMGIDTPLQRKAHALDTPNPPRHPEFLKLLEKTTKAGHPVVPSMAYGCPDDNAACLSFITLEHAGRTHHVFLFLNLAAYRLQAACLASGELDSLPVEVRAMLPDPVGFGDYRALAIRKLLLGSQIPPAMMRTLTGMFETDPGLPPVFLPSATENYAAADELMQMVTTWVKAWVVLPRTDGKPRDIKQWMAWLVNQWNTRKRIPRAGALVSPEELEQARHNAICWQAGRSSRMTLEDFAAREQLIVLGEHLLTFREPSVWIPKVLPEVQRVITEIQSGRKVTAPEPGLLLPAAAAMQHEDCRKLFGALPMQFRETAGAGPVIRRLLEEYNRIEDLACVATKTPRQVLSDALGFVSYRRNFRLCPPLPSLPTK